MSTKEENVITLKRVALKSSTAEHLKKYELTVRAEKTDFGPNRVFIAVDESDNGGTPNRLVQLWLDPNEATALGQALISQTAQSNDDQIAKQRVAIDLLRAREQCFKGAVGSLDIVFKSESDRGIPGYAYYDLEYYCDYADDGEGSDETRELIATVENYEALFSPFPSVHVNQLRTLVGGNHHFTDKIRVSTKGFSFAQIKADYEAREAQLRELLQQQ